VRVTLFVNVTEKTIRPPVTSLISRSPAETEALGEKFGRAAQRGLGIAGRVHSPTFTLVNEYGGGRLNLFHLDLYRLETREQILSAGIGEYLSPDGVAVIEWAERIYDLRFTI
jgi:tRNA threonylcarbamoyladenosine biosynthesis protein TsaE